MPKSEEVCEVVAGGSIYRNWQSVSVEQAFDQVGWMFRLVAAEPTSGGKGFADLKLKPGDRVKVVLAGELAISGYVAVRQTAYDATNHAVQFDGGTRGLDAVYSAMPLKDGQFRNYPFEAIARKALEPIGLKLKIENPPKDFAKKFKDISVTPGQSVFDFIEMLARFRNVWLSSNEHGDIVAAGAPSASAAVADLQEGKNIISMIAKFDDLSLGQNIIARGQQRGDNQTDDDTARSPAASVEGDGRGPRTQMILPELPGDKDDMRMRVDHENDRAWYASMEVTVVSPGWQKPNGGLWKIREPVKIVSPMAMLDHTLYVARVVFSQDESGTKTTLTLVRYEAMGGISSPGVSGGNPENILPPAEKQKDARPEE